MSRSLSRGTRVTVITRDVLFTIKFKGFVVEGKFYFLFYSFISFYYYIFIFVFPFISISLHNVLASFVNKPNVNARHKAFMLTGIYSLLEMQFKG